MTSSCGFGFAHDVDTQPSASSSRSSGQPRTVLAPSAQATDSLLHILVLYCYCLKSGRPGNSEAQVGHRRTSIELWRVLTRLLLDFAEARVLLVLLTVFETYLAGIWAV